MSVEQTPAVFVAVLLAPDQFDLFSEILTEAIDVLDEHTHAMSGTVRSMDDLVLLDRDCLRMGLGWSSVPDGDVLTLSVGARPDQPLPGQGARFAADMLQKLVIRAEALFDVKRTLWQVAMLPLNPKTIAAHAKQLEIMNSEIRHQIGTQFLQLDPNQAHCSASTLPRAEDSAGLAAHHDANDLAEPDPSWVIQASALALSTTFVLVTPPVGLAMFTYAALRQGTAMDLLPRSLDFSGTQMPWFRAAAPQRHSAVAAE